VFEKEKAEEKMRERNRSTRMKANRVLRNWEFSKELGDFMLLLLSFSQRNEFSFPSDLLRQGRTQRGRSKGRWKRRDRTR